MYFVSLTNYVYVFCLVEDGGLSLLAAADCVTAPSNTTVGYRRSVRVGARLREFNGTTYGFKIQTSERRTIFVANSFRFLLWIVTHIQKILFIINPGIKWKVKRKTTDECLLN